MWKYFNEMGRKHPQGDHFWKILEKNTRGVVFEAFKEMLFGKCVKKFVMDYHNKIKLIDNCEKTTFYNLAKQKFKICQWALGEGGEPPREI